MAYVDALDIVNYMLTDSLIIEVNEPHHSTVNFMPRNVIMINHLKLDLH